MKRSWAGVLLAAALLVVWCVVLFGCACEPRLSALSETENRHIVSGAVFFFGITICFALLAFFGMKGGKRGRCR